MSVDERPTIPLDVAWDTGAVEPVASKIDIPGHEIQESPGSRAGRKSITANGTEIPQQGQVQVQWTDEGKGNEKKRQLKSVFQITEVNRPLWSISKLLDNQVDPESEVVFRKGEAFARDSKGKVFARATRQGGLYVAQLQLKNLNFQGFHRQGCALTAATHP